MIKEDQKYLNFWNSVFLGIIFMICYAPFMTVQNMMTDIEKTNGFNTLGYQLLAVFYLC